MITEREKSAVRTTNHESKLPNGKPMTREDIIRMAREAGVYLAHTELTLMTGLERFAALVAAHEREECAKLCEEQIKAYMSNQYTTDPLGGFREKFASRQCATAIRARGEK
jgi:hypothetical protein